MAFKTQQASELLLTAANNLIIGGERILTDTHDDLNAAAENWDFGSNWWERGIPTDLNATRSGTIAEFKSEQSLRFVSRDPDHADFLRPTSDVEWLNAGSSGTPLQHLGTLGPRSVATPP